MLTFRDVSNFFSVNTAIVDGDGIHADPEKIAAITVRAVPSGVSQLRQFLEMINQLSKFSPELAEKSKPLRELLSTKE